MKDTWELLNVEYRGEEAEFILRVKNVQDAFPLVINWSKEEMLKVKGSVLSEFINYSGIVIKQTNSKVKGEELRND